MALQLLPSDINLIRAVPIEQPTGLPGIQPVQPSVSVGDMVRLFVREGQVDGKGLVVLNGQLVLAQLPTNVKPGDRLLAQVQANNEQLLLRILEKQSAGLNPGGRTEQVVNNIAKQLAASSRELFFPREVSLAPQQALEGFVQQRLAATLKLPESTTLASPQEAFKQLVNLTSGELTKAFREAAAMVRQSVIPEAIDSNNRFLLTLRKELVNLLEGTVKDNKASAGSLGHLINVLARETGEEQLFQELGKKDSFMTREVLRDLRRAVANQQDLKPLLKSLVSKLDQELPTALAARTPLDAQRALQLNTLAEQFDKIATTQETLNKLNPMMQAMGEPALLLFPFLFQGLLQHSEITITPKPPKKFENEQETGGGEKRGEQAPYQRIQVTVPLPHMGLVGVDIAHRSEEILVRLTVPDQAMAGYFIEQMENLITTLRTLGFKRADLVANVGKPDGLSQDWTIGLQTSRELTA